MICPRCGEPMTGGICDNCGFPLTKMRKKFYVKNNENVRKDEGKAVEVFDRTIESGA